MYLQSNAPRYQGHHKFLFLFLFPFLPSFCSHSCSSFYSQLSSSLHVCCCMCVRCQPHTRPDPPSNLTGCPAGRFGQDCTLTCTCTDNGYCTSDGCVCLHGWTGEDCSLQQGTLCSVHIMSIQYTRYVHYRYIHTYICPYSTYCMYTTCTYVCPYSTYCMYTTCTYVCMSIQYTLYVHYLYIRMSLQYILYVYYLYICMSIQYILYVYYLYIRMYVHTVHTVCTLPVHTYVFAVHTVSTLPVHMYVLTAHTYCIIVHMSVQYIRNVSTYLFNIHT